jgi:hypothetical protein
MLKSESFPFSSTRPKRSDWSELFPIWQMIRTSPFSVSSNESEGSKNAQTNPVCLLGRLFGEILSGFVDRDSPKKELASELKQLFENHQESIANLLCEFHHLEEKVETSVHSLSSQIDALSQSCASHRHELQDRLTLLDHLPTIASGVNKVCEISSELVNLRSLISGAQTQTQNSVAELRSDLSRLSIGTIGTDVEHLKQSIDDLRLLFPPHYWQFRSESPLDGILTHLTTKAGGNVHDQGIVSAFSDSVQTPVHAPKNAADMVSRSYFCSDDQPNQSMGYDFRTLRIVPSHYSLRSFTSRTNNHPKSWVIEVSDTGDPNAWTVVDAQDNSPSLNGADLIASFPILCPRSCRFIRIRQTGPNHSGHNYLLFSAFEIFGSLIEHPAQ